MPLSTTRESPATLLVSTIHERDSCLKDKCIKCTTSKHTHLDHNQHQHQRQHPHHHDSFPSFQFGTDGGVKGGIWMGGAGSGGKKKKFVKVAETMSKMMSSFKTIMHQRSFSPSHAKIVRKNSYEDTSKAVGFNQPIDEILVDADYPTNPKMRGFKLGDIKTIGLIFASGLVLMTISFAAFTSSPWLSNTFSGNGRTLMDEEELQIIHENMNVATSLFVIVVCGVIGGQIFERGFGQPAMLGMLMAGLAVRNLSDLLASPIPPTTSVQETGEGAVVDVDEGGAMAKGTSAVLGFRILAIPHSWTSKLWTVALCAVIARAGLTLQRHTLWNHARATLMLGTIPILTEAFCLRLMVMAVFGLPPVWASTLAFGVASISPGVVVPLLLNFVDKTVTTVGNHMMVGPAVQKFRPSRLLPIMLAATGVDVLVATTCFGVSMAAIFGHKHERPQDGDSVATGEDDYSLHASWLARGAEEVMGGFFLGSFWGFFGYILHRMMTNDNHGTSSVRRGMLGGNGAKGIGKRLFGWCFGIQERVATSLLFTGSAVTMCWVKSSGFPGAASFATIITWSIVANTWEKEKIDAANKRLKFVWKLSEPFLFSVIGASVSLFDIPFTLLSTAMVLVALGVLVKVLAALITTCMWGSEWKWEECIFVAGTWSGKASVQAALSGATAELVQHQSYVRTLSKRHHIFIQQNPNHFAPETQNPTPAAGASNTDDNIFPIKLSQNPETLASSSPLGTSSEARNPNLRKAVSPASTNNGSKAPFLPRPYIRKRDISSELTSHTSDTPDTDAASKLSRQEGAIEAPEGPTTPTVVSYGVLVAPDGKDSIQPGSNGGQSGESGASLPPIFGLRTDGQDQGPISPASPNLPTDRSINNPIIAGSGNIPSNLHTLPPATPDPAFAEAAAAAKAAALAYELDLYYSKVVFTFMVAAILIGAPSCAAWVSRFMARVTNSSTIKQHQKHQKIPKQMQHSKHDMDGEGNAGWSVVGGVGNEHLHHHQQHRRHHDTGSDDFDGDSVGFLDVADGEGEMDSDGVYLNGFGVLEAAPSAAGAAE